MSSNVNKNVYSNPSGAGAPKIASDYAKEATKNSNTPTKDKPADKPADKPTSTGKQVTNTNASVAKANPGDWIVRKDGSKYVLKAGDISWAKSQSKGKPADKPVKTETVDKPKTPDLTDDTGNTATTPDGTVPDKIESSISGNETKTMYDKLSNTSYATPVPNTSDEHSLSNSNKVASESEKFTGSDSDDFDTDLDMAAWQKWRDRQQKLRMQKEQSKWTPSQSIMDAVNRGM